MKQIRLIYFAVSALLLNPACSSEESLDMTSPNVGGGYADTGTSDRGGDMGADASASDSAHPRPDLPPEQEENLDLGTPSASLSYVFVANSTLNSIARIDSLTLGVTPIEVCLMPTEVRTLPTIDWAIALCEGDDQLAIIDSTGGVDEVSFVWLAENSNRILLSPTADYALAWYDEEIAEALDHPGNPHDLTLIDLDRDGGEPTSYLLTVGFGIRSIQFDAAGDTIFITTEDGLNVVTMAEIEQDQFIPLLSLGDDPLARAPDREVLVTDDGAMAFVRTSTYSGLRVLEIATGELSDIPLPAVPTDLDLFPGGEQGIAVLREISSVAILPLPGAVDDNELIEIIEIGQEVIGLAQLSTSSEQVLLYSTAVLSTHLTLLDLESHGHTTFALRKEVSGVMMAPTGDRAVVFHPSNGGIPIPGEPLTDFIAKSYGFTLFDLPSGFARLVTTDTDVDDVVFTEDGVQAFAMLEDSTNGVQEVQWIDFGSFRVDRIEMARPPESLGVVPATGRIYISQLADTGRITFIDTETGRLQHVTAYQLNRRIE